MTLSKKYSAFVDTLVYGTSARKGTDPSKIREGTNRRNVALKNLVRAVQDEVRAQKLADRKRLKAIRDAAAKQRAKDKATRVRLAATKRQKRVVRYPKKAAVLVSPPEMP